MMPSPVQASYVDGVIDDLEAMDARCSVHWEWFYQWGKAIEGYFPR